MITLPGAWLDQADRKRLPATLVGAREARVYRRLEALLVAEGLAWPRRPAAAGLIAPASTGGWSSTELGMSPPRCATGRAARWARLHRTLTPQRLAAALGRDPHRCGYQATSWTVQLLAHDLAAKGLVVSPRTLRRRLHEAGYRWKWPRYVYVERAAHLPQKKGGHPTSEGGLAQGRSTAVPRLDPSAAVSAAAGDLGAQGQSGGRADHQAQCQAGAVWGHRPANGAG
jgi:hypothetical protein